MMELTKSSIDDLNFVLNEATLLGMTFTEERETINIIISPVRFDEQGKVPKDNRVGLVFGPVSRLAASCRAGRWDNKDAAVITMSPQQVSDNIERFGQFAIYGDAFLDEDPTIFQKDEARLSFDYHNPKRSLGKHSFEFSRDTNNFLSVKLWFETLVIVNAAGDQISIEDLVAGVKRAWGYSGALNQFGIITLKDMKKDETTISSSDGVEIWAEDSDSASSKTK